MIVVACIVGIVVDSLASYLFGIAYALVTDRPESLKDIIPALVLSQALGFMCGTVAFQLVMR